MSEEAGNNVFNVEAALARMEGKMDRWSDRMSTIAQDHADFKARLNGHSERLRKAEDIAAILTTSYADLKLIVGGCSDGLRKLEDSNVKSTGIKEGINLSARVVYTVLTIGGLGTLSGVASVIIAVLRH